MHQDKNCAYSLIILKWLGGEKRQDNYMVWIRIMLFSKGLGTFSKNSGKTVGLSVL